MADVGIDRLSAPMHKCYHTEGFTCQLIQYDDKHFINGFVCNLRCGYWLTFDPVSAGKVQEQRVPERQWLDDWKITVPSMHPFPKQELLDITRATELGKASKVDLW